MDKRNCPEGQNWDILLKVCLSMPVESSPLSPTLWICVVPVIIGSFVILALWCVILRRKSRKKSNSENEVTELELLQKTKANFHPPVSNRKGQTEMFHGSTLTLAQFHAESQTASKREEDPVVCRGPERRAMSDHRVPLPATELGGTALVTTKTV
ncbi:hypothetical protein OJAV_G00075330 [Oryzias javanicus]|uniref:Uncharacterized protein n=1 Tax=Oryzias javanicus TaxID=123683 RepID=A0A3S2PKI8_ORYJA|nr:hypothetical protein OJAV_G00075330 [Oryzias javanicus]